jgi:hypothetical protein
VSNTQTLKQLQSAAESHPIFFLGGALGAGLLLGKLAPRAVGALLKLGGGLAWKFFVLPKIGERLASAMEQGELNLGSIDKEAALGLVGLQPKPSTAGRLLAGVGLIGAGLITGASLGFAYAPKPGIELRRELSRRLREAAKTTPANTLDEPLV